MTRSARSLFAPLLAAALLPVTLLVAVPAAGATTATSATSVTEPGTPDGSGDQTMGGGASTAGTIPPATVGALATGRATGTSPTRKGGNGFDTCTAPSADAMRAWLASPYRTVGIYIGGVSRSCSQPNLTPDWVRTVTGLGWNLMPTYVGLQAPHATRLKGGKQVLFPHRMSTDRVTAIRQGADAARDAIAQMRALGIPATAPIYLDVEAYSPAKDSAAVKAYTHGWTSTLRALGWLSGIYGSSNSMIADLVAWRADTSYASPDEIWFARWNGVPTADDPVLPPDAWAGHRVHQFAGGGDGQGGKYLETWGGVTLHIDSNYVDTASTPQSLVTALNPRLLYDSRAAKIGTKPTALAVAGHAGVPRDAAAAVLNVQIAAPSADGSLIVTPYKGRGNSTVQQFRKGGYISTTVVVPLAAKAVQFRLTAGRARLIVSAVGYLSATAGDRVTAMAPRIVYDSRTAKIGTRPTALAVAGVAGIPRDATAAILHVQVVHPTSAGNLIVRPYRSGATVGEQQFRAGQAISTMVTVPLSEGNIEFRLSAGKARVIVAAVGYTTPAPPAAAGAGTPPSTAVRGGLLTATSPSLAFDTHGVISTRPVTARLAGVPNTATAALLNVEVVNPNSAGNLIVRPYRSGAAVGVQQFAKGRSVSTAVLVPVINGSIEFYLSAGRARVIVTNLGYVTG